METKKMSLANMQGKLSRAEMKNVMAGAEGEGGFTCEWTSNSGTITAGACNGPSVAWCNTQTQAICSQTPNCQTVCCY